jgi:hypothetical protein
MQQLGRQLEEQLSFLFNKLKVNSTYELMKKYIRPVDVNLEVPPAFKA